MRCLPGQRGGQWHERNDTAAEGPEKKLWVGYAVILAIVILSNIFLYPALMQAGVKSVNYSTFLQMLESKELATVQIEDQQIYFVDKNENSFKTNAIAQDNNLVARLEDAGVEFGTVYQSPTIWDSLLNLIISFLPMILLFWFINRWASKRWSRWAVPAAMQCCSAANPVPSSMLSMMRPASSSMMSPVRTRPRRVCRRS